MTTPRTITLTRVPDLQTLHGSIADLTHRGGPLAARTCAVLVPTSGSAQTLRHTLENRALTMPGAVAVLPDFVTRASFYARLHRQLRDAPPMLSDFEREVLVRRAARVASESGSAAPFRLRAGLIVEILGLYDDLRRRGRTVGDFERLMIESLEPGADSDRGAERMLRQTRFLVAVFRELERRVAATARIDEHGLRALLIEGTQPSPYTRVIVTVGDQAGDAQGLWLADFNLLARMPGIEHVDVLATEQVLAAGLHDRLHDTFPGLAEERLDAASSTPVLVTPEPSGDRSPRYFVSRDREEELADVVRTLTGAPVSDRTAVVFQRPLPYLYLARGVFDDARVPHQTRDARPLAAEPFAAAVDLIFEVALSEATRAPLVDLLASPQWSFGDGVTRDAVAALDTLLREAKYLGGWDRLVPLAAAPVEVSGGRSARLRSRAGPALHAAVVVAQSVRETFEAPKASLQFGRLVALIKTHERSPADGDESAVDYRRARGAILGALHALAEAHAAHDDEPLLATELANTVRRWIEGQTFAPARGRLGVMLLDARAAAYADVDDVRLVGLVDSDWPERSRRSIFYPASLLGQLGWPNEIDRLRAARARFHDLLRLARQRVSVSAFTLEDDAIVTPSTFLEEIEPCGLDVEVMARASASRRFLQEVMRESDDSAVPLDASALSPVAFEWLALRTARTPCGDEAFHGEAGARPPSTYAVSHVERYLDCPFKYFASYTLGLEEERDDEAGLTPRERGQFVHEVFERFFAAWQVAGGRTITADTLQDALGIFETVVEAQLADLPEAERALERTYLLGSAAAPGLAERAFAFEIEQGIGVIERLLEYPLSGSFELAGEGGPVRLQLRGKTDRIDLLEDGTLRVVDYKLGRAPKPARALQLPVYAVCASQQLEGHRGRSWPLGRAGYVAFREKSAFVSIGNTPQQTAQAIEDGQRRMVAAVTAIEAGHFPVDPDEPFLCTRCGYAGVCRKDYVGDE